LKKKTHNERKKEKHTNNFRPNVLYFLLRLSFEIVYVLSLILTYKTKINL
jgi:hypothetical protein